VPSAVQDGWGSHAQAAHVVSSISAAAAAKPLRSRAMRAQPIRCATSLPTTRGWPSSRRSRPKLGMTTATC